MAQQSETLFLRKKKNLEKRKNRCSVPTQEGVREGDDAASTGALGPAALHQRNRAPRRHAFHQQAGAKFPRDGESREKGLCNEADRRA